MDAIHVLSHVLLPGALLWVFPGSCERFQRLCSVATVLQMTARAFVPAQCTNASGVRLVIGFHGSRGRSHVYVCRKFEILPFPFTC